MKIDIEFKTIIPTLTPDEYSQLEENILKEGIRDKLITWDGILIDGHNRFSIAQEHNLEYTTEEKQFYNRDEAIKWIILNQFGRRNLNSYNRSILALKLEDMFRTKAKEKQKESGGAVPQKSAKPPIDTRKELSKIAGVSHDTIHKVKRIEKEATPEIKQKLMNNEMSINEAHKKIVNEEKIQKRQEYIEEQRREIENGITEPTGKYSVIVIDPPWQYGREYSPTGSRVANPYPEMGQEELLKLDIPSEDDCVMFLWTTHAFIWNAKELLTAWGFEYKAMVIWDKEKIGMGNWLRMQCEFCLVGIKGKPIWQNTKWRDIIRESRREHSRKPETFYEMVSEITAGRKLDFFSRSQRNGWDCFGNEIGKY